MEDSESDAAVPSSSTLTVKEKRKCPSGITRGTEDLPPALTVHTYYRYSRSHSLLEGDTRIQARAVWRPQRAPSELASLETEPQSSFRAQWPSALMGHKGEPETASFHMFLEQLGDVLGLFQRNNLNEFFPGERKNKTQTPES